jgi:glycosyltransferase involved in cell wall biosynthesis
MQKILIVAAFTQLPDEKGSNRGRFKRIAEMLAQEGYDVTVVTSRFRELDRTFRKDEEVFKNAPYKIVLLDEIGYTRNISFRRIMSMSSFTRSLTRFLKNTSEKFDLVYTCVPGLDSSIAAGKYAKAHGVPLLIDVQDLWPEAMYALYLDVPVISNLLFLPIQLKANKVYAMADGIMAVSKTYMDVAAGKIKKCREKDYVFIGSDIDSADVGPDLTPEPISKPQEEFWIAYIGSLGHSYDIVTLLDAAKLANDKGINARPIIIGSGPLEKEMKDHAQKIGSNALFLGWVDHAIMENYLAKSDAVINAIKKKAPQSITNKVADYLSSGKPMLNGSQNQELKGLLSEYRFGVNYEPESPGSLAAAIEEMAGLSDLERAQLGKNARRLAEEKFDRKVTYPGIIRMIEKLLR